jgi:hypothetical protein
MAVPGKYVEARLRVNQWGDEVSELPRLTLLAIDPGPKESAYVVLRAGRPTESGKWENHELNVKVVRKRWHEFRHMAIEMVASYGAPVGEEVFETCLWIGRFIQTFGEEHTKYRRHEIKTQLCPGIRGVNDAVIRQRLIDLYGGKEKAIGNKKNQGPLYGIKGDCWQALAVGYVWLEKNRAQEKSA